MLKRVLAIVLSVVLAISIVPMQIYAANDTGEFAGGSGTASDPYLISNKYHLNNVRNYLSAHYRMISDVTFEDYDFSEDGDFYNNGAGWLPIGYENKNFSGVFDGGFHTIRNLQITATIEYSGLFSRVTNIVKNLTLSANITSTYNYTGGIAGKNTGLIDNCGFEGSINGNFAVGGIVADNNSGKIIQCYNYGSIYGSGSSIGGIAGWQTGEATISYCENSGSVKSTDTINHYGYAGGILGHGEGIIEYCSSHGIVTGDTAGGIVGKTYEIIWYPKVSYCFNTGKVAGTTTSSKCGGIVGDLSWATLNSCYNSGTVGNSSSWHGGGIAGYVYHGSMLNCYNSGDIWGSSVGGIYGYSKFSTSTNKCYNIGNLYGKYDTGGIAGHYSGGAHNCYYLNNASSAVGSEEMNISYACGATVCTSEEMQRQATFDVFDFVNVWSISEDVNNGYPYLNEVPVYSELDNISIKIYSEYPTTTIGKGRTVRAAVQVENNGQILYGSMIRENFEFSFATSDNTILTVNNIVQKNDGVYFDINGISEGVATLTIIENNTGCVYTATVCVSNGILSFNADALPSYYEFNQEFNGYIDGIYIDDFQKVSYDDYYAVSFNAYNSSSICGVVQVYDAQGNIKDIEVIDRFSNSNVTSIYDTLEKGWHLTWDIIEGDVFTYKSEILTNETNITVEVPLGGKVEITSNMIYSGACAIYNYVDFIMESLNLFTGAINASAEDYEVYSKEVPGKFLEQYLYFLWGDVKFDRYQVLATKLQDEIIKITENKLSKSALTTTIATFVDNGQQILSDLEIDLEEIILSTAKDTGISVAEDALQKGMGPFGEMLEGMFQFSKYSNYLAFFFDLVNLSDQQAFIIQFNDKDGRICDNGVFVKPTGTNSMAQDNFVLKSVIITNDSIDDVFKTSLDTLSSNQKYVVRDIYLERDGVVSQPNQEVTVTVPIPQDYDPEKCMVYWLKDDGSLVLKDADIQGNYLIFTTDHFSQYAVIELTDQDIGEENPNQLLFSSASLVLHHNLAINYKVDKALFEDIGYATPYVVFELDGVKTTVTDYTVDGDRYVFEFRDIAPNQMNDTIYATLYASYNGMEYTSETKEYSVAEYCYNMLEQYSADEYAELRTLLVDLLNYGAASQTYTTHSTEAPANAALTAEQAAWGTADTPELVSVLNTAYETIETPTVSWKSAGLNLNNSIALRFKIAADSVDTLSVKIISEAGTEWTISGDSFEAVEDGYHIYFDGLNAAQMREELYFTVYDGETAVSNTLCYSIESYAYNMQDSSTENLAELLIAMMKYGDSAYAYVTE